jgi:hypothetical protein
MHTKKTNIHAITLIACILIFIDACDNTFEPFQENNQYVFSMYGTIDLHADTQWVRVMPVGQTLLVEETEPMDATVELTRNSTGQTVTMRDSLFQFATDAFAWNYWVPITLHPDEAYTVTAKNSDNEESKVIIQTPSVLPVPEVVEYFEDEDRGIITGSSKDSLVVLEVRYRVQNLLCGPEVEIVISFVNGIDHSQEDYRVNMSNAGRIASRFGVLLGNYRVNSRKFVVVSVSEDWPDLAEYSDDEIVLPNVATNVENGTGFVPGIAKREIDITPPRERCYPSR